MGGRGNVKENTELDSHTRDVEKSNRTEMIINQAVFVCFCAMRYTTVKPDPEKVCKNSIKMINYIPACSVKSTH
jgi:hypothetical protein